MISTPSYVQFFEDFGIDDVSLVGGKNASLGEMFQKLAGQGVRVPHGFAITAAAYRHMLDQADAWDVAVAPGLTLSRAAVARLPMTWIALLRGRIDASLAATTGVEGSTELIKYLLAGADVVMTASALLRHGPGYATVMIDELRAWMERKGYTSIDDVRGLLAVPIGTDEVALERTDYVTALRRANSGKFSPW